MRAIGVYDLKTHASEIMRKVREERIAYTITYRGKPFGVQLPLEEHGDVDPGKHRDAWANLEKLRERMARMPRPEKSLTEALAEMRR